jgi:hypothetical protein
MKTGNGKAVLSATAGLSALVCYTAFPERRREKIRNADTIVGETKNRKKELQRFFFFRFITFQFSSGN